VKDILRVALEILFGAGISACVSLLLYYKFKPKSRIVRWATILCSPVIFLGLTSYLWLSQRIELAPSESPVPSESQSAGSEAQRPSIPQFPWPPPTPSARVTIPIESFYLNDDYGSISDELTQALDSRGYVEKSYYGVPNGFAVVTRLERFYQNGLPFAGPDRWVISDPEIRSIGDYLQALLRLDQGYFRVIVFVFTDQPFATAASSTVTSELANAWLDAGDNDLPILVREQPTPRSAKCTMLIYEFSKRRGFDPDYDKRSLIAASTHMTGSGILHALSVAHGGSK